MTIIFFGSDPWFSPPVMEAISKAGHQISLVVTRGNAFENFRTKNSNLRFVDAKTEEDILRFTNGTRPDAIILAAFGPPFLPPEILNWPKYGCLNVHASLLPRWRGASPVFGAIANGDKETGVSIMRMMEEVDRGNILGQKTIQINQPSNNESAPAVRSPLPWSPSTRRGVATAGFGRTSDFSNEKSGPSEKPYDNRESLTRRLGILGGELIVETLKKIENGQVEEIQQPAESPTPYTHRLTKNSGRIDWKKSPGEIERFIRAVTPWPGAWTEYKEEGRRKKEKGKIIKILQAHLEKNSPKQLDCHAPQSGTRNDMALKIDEVQLPGKNPISWKAFLAGHPGAELE